QVIKNDEGVAARLHEFLAHRAPRIRREVLKRRRVGGCCGNHGRILHRTELLQNGDDLRHLRRLLADSYVDAEQVQALLVNDSVEGDGGLADLSVADNKLALASPDRYHRVDGFDTR